MDSVTVLDFSAFNGFYNDHVIQSYNVIQCHAYIDIESATCVLYYLVWSCIILCSFQPHLFTCFCWSGLHCFTEIRANSVTCAGHRQGPRAARFSTGQRLCQVRDLFHRWTVRLFDACMINGIKDDITTLQVGLVEFSMIINHQR